MLTILLKVISWFGGLSAPVKWLLKILIEILEEKAKAWIQKREDKKKNRAIAEENLKRDKEATDLGDLDEIAKAGEDLLNGRDRRK